MSFTARLHPVANNRWIGPNYWIVVHVGSYSDCHGIFFRQLSGGSSMKICMTFFFQNSVSPAKRRKCRCAFVLLSLYIDWFWWRRRRQLCPRGGRALQWEKPTMFTYAYKAFTTGKMRSLLCKLYMLDLLENIENLIHIGNHWAQ